MSYYYWIVQCKGTDTDTYTLRGGSDRSSPNVLPKKKKNRTQNVKTGLSVCVFLYCLHCCLRPKFQKRIMHPLRTDVLSVAATVATTTTTRIGSYYNFTQYPLLYKRECDSNVWLVDCGQLLRWRIRQTDRDSHEFGEITYSET